MNENPSLIHFKKILFIFSMILFLAVTFFATVVLANQHTVNIAASVVNVRTGPGLSYDIMAQVTDGQKVNVVEEKNEWFKVRLSNDQVGWIASWLVDNTEVSAATNRLGTISVSEAVLRSEASEDAETVGAVLAGTELTVLFQQNGWTQVQYLGEVAWVNSDLIEVSNQVKTLSYESEEQKNESSTIQKVTVRSSGTNIRTGPSIESSLLTTASKGDSFLHVATEDDWYKIELLDGQTGYIASWLVDLSTDDGPAATTSISSLAEATIVIDAGHGGEDPGASANSYYEKEVTLKTAQQLAKRLRDAGSNVILTRGEDVTLSLYQRILTSRQTNADVFISLHYDSTENPNENSGTATYYYQEKNKKLAETINNRLAKDAPLPNNGVRFGNYYVIRENSQPSILLELGYLNNDIDQVTVYSDSYQAIVAESIYQALNDYFVP